MANEQEGTLTVEKLLAIRKDFIEKFPPIDHTKTTAMFANWFHMQYGFKIICRDVADDCIAVSPNVYLFLMDGKNG